MLHFTPSDEELHPRNVTFVAANKHGFEGEAREKGFSSLGVKMSITVIINMKPAQVGKYQAFSSFVDAL